VDSMATSAAASCALPPSLTKVTSGTPQPVARRAGASRREKRISFNLPCRFSHVGARVSRMRACHAGTRAHERLTVHPLIDWVHCAIHFGTERMVPSPKSTQKTVVELSASHVGYAWPDASVTGVPPLTAAVMTVPTPPWPVVQ
jgi:hypothetical protein